MIFEISWQKIHVVISFYVKIQSLYKWEYLWKIAPISLFLFAFLMKYSLEEWTERIRVEGYEVVLGREDCREEK